MKQQTQIFTLTLLLLIAYPVFAQNTSHEGHDHSTHEQTQKTEDHAMDHSSHSGVLIHESDVKGFKFAYHLIDMREKMKNMKLMPEMKDTHHLMVYVKNSHGHALEKAKVGYMLKNPDGSVQKKMAMGMGAGFGADINLNSKGSYKIKTKLVDGNTKLMDDFEYEVK